MYQAAEESRYNEIARKYDDWRIVQEHETWQDLQAKIEAQEADRLDKLRNAKTWEEARFIQGQLSVWRLVRILMNEPATEYEEAVADEWDQPLQHTNE